MGVMKKRSMTVFSLAQDSLLQRALQNTEAMELKKQQQLFPFTPGHRTQNMLSKRIDVIRIAAPQTNFDNA